jgi:hypothetical protein
MAMKRLQDGQFDECDLSLRELSLIEASMVKTLAAHYHGRVAYPKLTYAPKEPQNGRPPNNHKMESPEEIQTEHSEQTPEQTEQETN